MLPFATNMMQIYWSDEVAEVAQKTSATCNYQHSTIQQRKLALLYLGENFSTRGADPTQKWNDVIDSWFKDISAFRNKNVIDFVADNTPSDNFSQMIWANSYLIGCGFTRCKDKSFYVCNYGPIGNVVGKPVFKPSTTLTCNCPKATTCGNVYYKSLCCPNEHCKKENLVYNGQPIEGTIPMIK